MSHVIRLIVLFLFVFSAAPLSAQMPRNPLEPTGLDWVVTSAEIPMRDGIKLHTVIAAPRHHSASMPIMIECSQPTLAGYELIISDEVFRGRFRKSFEHPEAIPSNCVEEYHIDLHSADHVFLKGHRIGVQIQSAWFPLIDRNPQRFVPNIFEAKPEDYQTATQRIYRSQRHATHLVLPVKETAKN